MKARAASVLILFATGFGPLTSCGTDTSREGSSVSRTEVTPLVYTVNYPLQYFAERIGGDQVRVEFPAPVDVDPAFWMPSLEALAGYQSADLILLNGATYAKWIDKVSLPESRLVFTADGFADQLISLEGEVTHTHGPGGEHSHAGTAFTTWLDPTLAVVQAEAIRQAFTAEWPAHATEFQTGFEALERDLIALDRRLAETVGSGSNMPLLASHPVYQYLSRRYGLDIRSVHWEPDEAPNPAMWRDLRTILQGDHPARWMLWEETPIVETARQLRDLGVEPLVFDQCGNRPEQGDYLSVMQENVTRLERIFGN